MICLNKNTKGTLMQLYKTDESVQNTVLWIELNSTNKADPEIDISFLKNSCAYIISNFWQSYIDHDDYIYSLCANPVNSDDIMKTISEYDSVVLIISDMVLDEGGMYSNTFDVELVDLNKSRISIEEYDKNSDKYRKESKNDL